MVNRTGTYFGFDGLGEADPSKSDYKFYATVQGWAAGKHIDFKFVNSHEKASAVRDSSKRATLEASIMQRLRASKNMVVILSDDTRKSGSMFSFEIEKAVDTYDLPLIIAHTGYVSILDPGALSNRWPSTLQTRINNGNATAIHIPFKKEAILNAIGQFTVNSSNLTGGLNYYNRETYVGWGYIR
jgi:hypothetical protein